MNSETLSSLDQLPDGKTELPATVTVNKLRDDINLNFKIHLKLKGKDEISNNRTETRPASV